MTAHRSAEPARRPRHRRAARRYGDGICCVFGAGSYTLSLDGETVATGGQFFYFEETDFDTRSSPPSAPPSPPAPREPPSAPPSPPSPPQEALLIRISPDDYPLEVSWTLERDAGGGVWAQLASAALPPSAEPQEWTERLLAGRYNFTILDEYGDGLCWCARGAAWSARRAERARPRHDSARARARGALARLRDPTAAARSAARLRLREEGRRLTDRALLAGRHAHHAHRPLACPAAQRVGRGLLLSGAGRGAACKRRGVRKLREPRVLRAGAAAAAAQPAA